MAKVVGELKTKVWGVERVSKIIEENGEYYIEGKPVKAYNPKTKDIIVLDPLGHYIADLSPEIARNYYTEPIRVKLYEPDIRDVLTTPFRR